MKPRVDITGQKFGSWTALEYVGKKYWKCQCSCGSIVNVDGSKLRSGKTQGCRSCGHRKYDTGTYGSRLYNIWNNIKQRCTNHNTPAYKWYGAKGIEISNEWSSDFEVFKEWSIANGYNINMTIDRIDPRLGYNSNNCQWLTLSDNSKKSQLERGVSPISQSGERNVSWNLYKKKYDLTINAKYYGSYHTVEAAVFDRDYILC